MKNKNAGYGTILHIEVTKGFKAVLMQITKDPQCVLLLYFTGTCSFQQNIYKPWWQLDLVLTYDIIAWSFNHDGSKFSFQISDIF